MSSTLAYRPVNPNIHMTCGDKIKSILRSRFDLDQRVAILGVEDVEYLRGLFDAGVEDAKKLIDAIDTYGNIEIFLVH